MQESQSSRPFGGLWDRRKEDEAFHDLIESRLGTFKRGSATLHGPSSVTRRATREDAFYSPRSFVGKSLVRIQTDRDPMGRTKDSDVYDKWAQALSSAVELAESAWHSAENLSVPRFFTAVMPVVVVPDDLLWRAVYDDNGDVSTDPAQVKECELFVERDRSRWGKGYTHGFISLPFRISTSSHLRVLVHFCPRWLPTNTRGASCSQINPLKSRQPNRPWSQREAAVAPGLRS